MPERVLTLQGATNFRDLGGYPTVDGGYTRWGMVYRSDAPHRLSIDDLAIIERLGLLVAYDLRTDEERDRSPSALPATVRRIPLTIGGTAAHTRANAEMIRTRPADIPDDFLAEMYRRMADFDAGIFGRILTELADADGTPALIHCTAGKDRTGVAAALLLAALGVDETTILDDYELSAIHFTDRRLPRLLARLPEDVDPARYRAVFGAPRLAMATLLTTLREQHGSIEGYLRTRAGLSASTLTALRDRLVQSAVS
ncbi:tyrosine-protein phosphatase [Nocardia sp. NPDC049526]|uniref:tyrosine-protein phosphatase n=1 Tax=Nocardia sp. NPDC049526 TaxID=3364316 RepID=UPI00379E6315